MKLQDPIKQRTAQRALSALEGPLSQLLEARNIAWLDLERAKLKIKQFLAACEVIRKEAAGLAVNREALPPMVQGLIKQIQFRAAAKSVHFVQRAD